MMSIQDIKKQYHEKISVRTLVQIILLITVMSSSFTTLFVLHESKLLKDNLTRKYGLLSELLAYNSRLCVFSEHSGMCGDLVSGLLHHREHLMEILSVSLFTSDGKLVAGEVSPINIIKTPDKATDMKKMPDLKAIFKDGPRHDNAPHYYHTIREETISFWSPVISVSYPSPEEAIYFDEKTLSGTDRIIGFAEIIIDKRILDRQLAVLLQKGILMGVVFLMAGLTVTYFTITRFTVPLEKLTAASEKISSGNMDVTVEVTGSDEIGRLTRSFNRMAASLKESDKINKELNESLELKVRERTRQLTEAQKEIVRNEKLAVLGQLAGGVGHELRNPLGVINNAVYFLKTVLGEGPGTVKEYLDIIKYEVNTAERIISDLLDFARTKTPHPQRIRPLDLIDQALARCSITEGIDLVVNLPETIPSVAVDPIQIGSVFQNLIQNAVQAMPAGGVLRIEARRSADAPAPSCAASDEGGDFVEISVADTGEGISPENMKMIFQPLFTTKPKGMGLGLVVSRKLSEANGGRIDVRSSPGKGTTFTVILPISIMEDR